MKKIRNLTLKTRDRVMNRIRDLRKDRDLFWEYALF